MISSIFNKKYTKNTTFTGLTDELFSVYINEVFNENDNNILIVTSTMYEANKLYEILTTFNEKVVSFLMDDFLTSEALAISPDLMIERLETLNKIKSNKKTILVTDLMGYLRFLPNKKTYYGSSISLKVGTVLNPTKLMENLMKLGYHRETLVTKTGEFGVRGFIIDIFPISENYPVRIEFFGDEIESIRYFDEKSQKSVTEISELEIKPFTEYITKTSTEPLKQKQLYFDEERQSIREYLEEPLVFFKDYNNIKKNYEITMEQIFEYQKSKDHDYTGTYLNELITKSSDNYYYSLDNYFVDSTTNVVNYNFEKVPFFNEDIELINDYINKKIYVNKTIILGLTDYQKKSVLKYINGKYHETDISKLEANSINIINFPLQDGFIKNDVIYIGANNLFKKVNKIKTYKSSYKYASKIKDINKLKPGDFVVHNTHGIGIYLGIKSLQRSGILKDFLEIAYYGTDKLYIPVEKIDLISKYSGKEGGIPKVHKLGGQEWWKTKQRIKEKVRDIAKELLLISAKRSLEKGHAFIDNQELEEKFNNDFIYQETVDQQKSYLEIKEDMEKEQPMDRLLCGDVGFGKTEVAFRAAFKAILGGKQVLYLCPTTILSNQHYENALERFKNFPVNIGILNRFTSKKDTLRIINELKDNKIDMVIGTHRLLSDDIKPHDLGLLIIDEEQRFGVTHKEKLKKMKETVDILTLSATPIPRTLQMSLSGLKNLSLIETPPVDRYPVQTYVIEENNQIIKDAIYKELSRGGQLFFLYNKVADIEKKTNEIKSLVPEARVIFAHGQMSKTELEDRMIAFTNHEYDVLVCTTIIETGIDIPNVNSLIIIDADRFGLSQLYQIRGRVGRSNKIAYAYLFYRKDRVLTETAMKRLEVIKEFTELGSGISIANRDLSIRGAGDILGSEQAGFIDSVGVDLYLKILNEEVLRLKGELPEEEDEESNESPVIEVETHISDKYVDDEDLKLEIHRMINSIKTKEDVEKITTELEDRFGKVTEEMKIYMYQEWLEKLVKKANVHKIMQTKDIVTIAFEDYINDKISGDVIFEEAYNISRNAKLKFINNRIIVIFPTKNIEKHFVYSITAFLSRIIELYFD